MMAVRRPRWPPYPYFVKTLRNKFSVQPKKLFLKYHKGCEVYQVAKCANLGCPLTFLRQCKKFASPIMLGKCIKSFFQPILKRPAKELYNI